ncbi:hypothetical protein [Salinibacter ruber]|uniref:hypothetical protein n=1 Tax=Salinibacter ruber TaxID=146919 RepID=UPI002168D397|nr:hypothetical protein [Salinibacter ruber]MCS4054455.1 hypothetical protein [Salinibacter ruber]
MASHRDPATSGLRLEAHEEVSSLEAAVLVVNLFRSTRSGWTSRSGLADQLDRLFVDADHRTLWIVRFCIQV